MKKQNDILYSNEFLDIEMINPNYPFLMVKKRGAVTVPYDKKGNIYMLHKWRPNVGSYYEVPRGFVENDEAFETGALRELLEETGMKATKLDFLGNVQPDTGLMANSVKMYALLVEEEEDFAYYDCFDKELCKVVKVPQSDLNELIVDGKIICSYTLSSVFVFKEKLGKLF